MAFTTIGRLIVVAHSKHSPSAGEWDSYIDEWRALLGTVDFVTVRTLVLTDGGAPNAEQRSKLNAVLAGRPSPVAVLSDSVVVRAVCTALAWFNPALKVFAPKLVVEAMRFLDLSPHEQGIAHEALQKLKGRFESQTMNSLPAPAP